MAFGDTEDNGSPSPRSAKLYLAAIDSYFKAMDRWFTRADKIDKIYSGLQSLNGVTLSEFSVVGDREYNLFWASMEVIKPSIYSRPPVPVVSTKFRDRSPVKRVTAELLERSAITGFEVTDINAEMLDVRDDLAINSRGQLWVSYEDDGEETVCIEALDRDDFAHEPARRWREVTWVARKAWLTRKEMEDRFGFENAAFATYSAKRDDDGREFKDTVEKAAVWEIWDKAEKEVVWVTDGIEDVLDRSEPYLDIQGFFPCPPPAYGTVVRRSLEPVPDMVYIQGQLETINLLTERIHDLAELLVVKGIVPAGTDLGDAVEKAVRTNDASYTFIPVPSMSMEAGKLVEWLPIEQVAQTILAAVEERRELIGNVQELLGVADIMRGDTEASETLGAQQLKAQYGSRRTRDRVKELERIARDAGRIMVEIFAEEFSLDTLLKMAQMELPTAAEVKKQIKDLEKQAKDALKALEDQAKQALQEQQQADPEAMQQAEAAFQQQQQEIIGHFTDLINKAASAVTVEAVRDQLKDTKTDPFVFDIETDSTIYPDEMAEKQARNEFMAAFTTASQALVPLVASGPAGKKMAGELVKFQLGPYRVGRELEGVVDEWIDSLETMPSPTGDEAANKLAESQMALAQAELQKAQAQTMKVEADAQGKMQEMQLRATEAETKAQADQQRIMLELENTRGKIAETEARIQKIFAEIEAMAVRSGNETRQQDRDDFKTVTDTQFRAADQQRAAESQAFNQASQVASQQQEQMKGTNK